MILPQKLNATFGDFIWQYIIYEKLYAHKVLKKVLRYLAPYELLNKNNLVAFHA